MQKTIIGFGDCVLIPALCVDDASRVINSFFMWYATYTRISCTISVELAYKATDCSLSALVEGEQSQRLLCTVKRHRIKI